MTRYEFDPKGVSYVYGVAERLVNAVDEKERKEIAARSSADTNWLEDPTFYSKAITETLAIIDGHQQMWSETDEIRKRIVPGEYSVTGLAAAAYLRAYGLKVRREFNKAQKQGRCYECGQEIKA